ncbi:carboxypeptidase regulatory-like domain-containing protein [Salmonella enterica]|nr:carboxypeptidase regulatory-like domain-containing protein [Salmonella enterica]EED3792123.1 carboxypeptidase regulatory-like domain-containing protein [Salmonella enterica subsp. enterica serovar Oranienburg]EGI0918550.1 carboxypeptidase regulatory-like domain-containing protein [Salmonella enterica]EGK8384637.1 carboxypeptidase regulatory-like domain-containing protein [Salmonella enterica]EGM2326896.1 carboxypeptidase regulatory-like domain-containing protein [Salmonella enterica]
MAKEHPGNGDYSVNYDVFSCNDGVAPEPGMSWNTGSGTWEWNDLSISSGAIPDNLSQEIRDALENNICVVCGRKNCPFIRQDKSYQELINALKNGDKSKASKIYAIKFSQFHNGKESRIRDTMYRIRNNKSGGGVFCQPRTSYNGPIDSRRVIATPGVWSEWIELEGFTGSLQHPQPSTINFSPSSNLESSFDVELKYPEHDQMKTIRTMGPGSYSFTATGAGYASVRVKSHSVPVTVTLDFPKRS